MTPIPNSHFPTEPCNVLLAGIGGQGVLTAAQLLAEAAAHAGYDAKKSEVHGMAQRGGVVTSHVRFGTKVYSPIIAPGAVDLLVAFEAAEGLRWRTEIRPNGRIVVNCLQVPPPVVNLGLFEYPHDPIEDLRKGGAIAVEASALAVELGSPRLAGTVLVGAAAAWLPIAPDHWEAAVRRRFRDALAEQNLQALRRGLEYARECQVPSAESRATGAG